MVWFLTAMVILVALLSLASLSATFQMRGFRPEPSPASLDNLPRISVVIPCKGDDGTLLENLETLVQQEHPIPNGIEYVLVTATEDDPACAVFAELKRRQPDRRIKTAVAGIPQFCSQQNNNQVKGVESADPASQIFVIMDSDGQADKRFIAKLAAPLSDPAVGATSGYRWYDPRWNRLPDLLRTAWNAGGFVFLVNPATSFVWGGAMAFRRETYEKANIRDVWSKALSDDMTLSRRLKSMGMRLKFVPDCIVVSKAPDTLRSAVHWTNRQTLVTRFYNSAFWLTAGIFHAFGNLLGWGLLIAGLVALIVNGPGTVATLALVGGGIWVAHLWLFALLMVTPLDQMLRPRGIILDGHRWMLVLVAPMASILQGINSINSCFTRRIRWAGITYLIQDHERMEVVPR